MKHTALAALIVLGISYAVVLPERGYAEHSDGSIDEEVNYNAVLTIVKICDNSNFIGAQRLDDAVATWNTNAANMIFEVVGCWSSPSIVVIYTNGGCGANSVACTYHPTEQNPQDFIIKMDATADDSGPERFTKALIHEMGHNLGFKHLTPGNVTADGRTITCNNSVMVPGDVGCAPYPITSQLIDREYYERAYRPGPVESGIFFSSPGTGQVLPQCETVTDPHTENQVTFWRSDAGWVYTGGVGHLAPLCVVISGQMPGTRWYEAFSSSNAYAPYYGDSVGGWVTVAGTNPSLTGLVAYSFSVIQVNFAFGNPAGTEVHIERANCSTCAFTQIATATASPYASTGLTAGTSYCYRVRAHSHTVAGAPSGGYSDYSATQCASTPPATPGSMGGSFNVDGNPNRVSACFSPMTGATYYLLFDYRAGAQSSSTYIASPNTSCYGSVLYTRTRSSEVYHFAVKACNPGGCSAYRDMSGSYWWWVPCSTPSGCSAGGSPDPGGHGH